MSLEDAIKYLDRKMRLSYRKYLFYKMMKRLLERKMRRYG